MPWLHAAVQHRGFFFSTRAVPGGSTRTALAVPVRVRYEYEYECAAVIRRRKYYGTRRNRVCETTAVQSKLRPKLPKTHCAIYVWRRARPTCWRLALPKDYEYCTGTVRSPSRQSWHLSCTCPADLHSVLHLSQPGQPCWSHQGLLYSSLSCPILQKLIANPAETYTVPPGTVLVQYQNLQ